MYTKEEITANRAKLVKALRSGKYEQCIQELAKVDAKGNMRYCVLGVACNESDTGNWVTLPQRGKFGWVNVYDNFTPNPKDILGFSTSVKTHEPVVVTSILPVSVFEFYGFTASGDFINSRELLNAISKSESDAANYVLDFLHPFDWETSTLSLVTLNDAINMPFPLIADFIEEFGEYLET